MMTIDDYHDDGGDYHDDGGDDHDDGGDDHDDGGDYHDDGGYKPEQVEVVLSLKTALYGTVIATYTVASKIAYSIRITEMRMRVKMRKIIIMMLKLGKTETDQVPEVFEVAIVG